MLLVLILPVAAWAGPKLAVTRIDGDPDEEVRDAVIEALSEGDFTLAKKKDVNKAADKAGDLTELTATGAKKLAKNLTADVIVVGAVVKDGAKKKFRVKLYANGAPTKKFTLQFRKATSNSFKRTVRTQVEEKLDTAGASEAVAEEETPKKGGKKVASIDEEEPTTKQKKGKNGKKAAKEEAEAEKPEKTEKVGKNGKKAAKEESEPKKIAKEEPEEDAPKSDAAEEEALATKKDKEVAAATPDEGGEDEPAVAKRAEAPSSARSLNRAAVRVNIGPSLLTRTLKFNSNLMGDQKPRDVKVSPVAGARIEAEVYPLALGNPDSFAAGFGLGVDMDYTASIKVAGEAAKQFSYAGGLRFRLVGRSATSPSVTLGLDYGRSRFKTEVDAMVASDYLPDIYYKFFAPGLAARFPVGARIALFAGGKGQIIQDAGEIVKPNSYGKAKVFGIVAQAGFEVLFGSRIALRASGEFAQVGYTFQDLAGELASGRDGDPTTLDVSGAADRSIGGALTLAVGY